MTTVDVCAICKREIEPGEWFIEDFPPHLGPLFTAMRHCDCKWPKAGNA